MKHEIACATNFIVFRIKWVAFELLLILQSLLLVRAACVRCHGTKCPLLMALFSLSFLSFFTPLLLFSQKELSKGSEILCGVLSHKKKNIWGKTKIGTPPYPSGGAFFSICLLVP